MLMLPLTNDEKISLFENLFSNNFEEIIRINTETTAGSTVYTSGSFFKSIAEDTYDYDNTIRDYLLDCSASPDTGSLW